MQITWEAAPSRDDIPLLVCRAAGTPLDAPVAVCVHGYGRQPLDMLEAFGPLAVAAGFVLVLPLFRDRGPFRQYQQLWSPRKPVRADLALLRALDRLAGQGCLSARRFCLFGHSGGGQFAHRLALLHPARVAALGIGAAGWYTWPDESWPWPLGLGAAEGFGAQASLEEFLSLPIRVWVGERDDGADEVLRDEPSITALQGDGRLKRAQRWVSALQQQAQQLGVTTDLALEVLPRAGHDFRVCQRRGGLANKVFAHFERVRASV